VVHTIGKVPREMGRVIALHGAAEVDVETSRCPSSLDEAFGLRSVDAPPIPKRSPRLACLKPRELG
jgi:hypothetical protein